LIQSFSWTKFVTGTNEERLAFVIVKLASKEPIAIKEAWGRRKRTWKKKKDRGKRNEKKEKKKCRDGKIISFFFVWFCLWQKRIKIFNSFSFFDLFSWCSLSGFVHLCFFEDSLGVDGRFGRDRIFDRQHFRVRIGTIILNEIISTKLLNHT